MKKIFLRSSLCIALSSIFLTSSIVSTFAEIKDLNSSSNITTSKDERGVVGGVIKAFKSWAKKNKSTITKAISSYIKTYPALKGISAALEDIFEDVYEIDENIDNFIYSAVDSLLPNVSSSTKKTIANAIRLASPF